MVHDLNPLSYYKQGALSTRKDKRKRNKRRFKMVKVVPEESAGINPRLKEGTYTVRLAGIVEKTLEVKTEKKEGDKTITETEQVERLEWTWGLRGAVAPDGKPISPDTTGLLPLDIRFTALTSPKFSTKSKAFSFTKALNGGKAPVIGQEFDTDDLIGIYAIAMVKDKKPKTDRTGNIQISSDITDLVPIDKIPEKEIVIEGLVTEDEPEDETPPPPPEPPKDKRKQKK